MDGVDIYRDGETMAGARLEGRKSEDYCDMLSLLDI